MFDNVEVYRVSVSGPLFSLRDIDMFQDTFPTDGETITGTCRVDMAQDIMPLESAVILPGDSAKVVVTDPQAGLGIDPTHGGAAVYCYISVDGDGPGPANPYTPQQIQAPEQRAGATRYPHVPALSGGGWEVYRMDSSFTSGGGLVEDTYCIDFNDDLFVPGDTIWFFFGAQSSIGLWGYASLPYGNTPSLGLIADNPDEVTMLPACGTLSESSGILYVDGMNFRGAQPYFDSSFEAIGELDEVDRYDVRGPSSVE
jgi:hypothetical protein